MRTVYKYPVTVTDEFDLAIPAGAEILHVAVQNHRPYLWALVEPARAGEIRHFAVRGTGHPVDDELRHLGSFLLYDDTFVGHLFERAANPPVPVGDSTVAAVSHALGAAA